MNVLKEIQVAGEPERSMETLERRMIKTMEEIGELAEAVLSFTSESGAKDKTWGDIMEEAVDTAIISIDIALTKPPGYEAISDNQIREMVRKTFARKLKKWEGQAAEGRTVIRRKQE